MAESLRLRELLELLAAAEKDDLEALEAAQSGEDRWG